MSKQRVIVEAVLAGKSQREVARLYGISQPRVSQLVAAWRAGGWQALEPKSRRPRSNANATAPDVVEQVLALRAELIADGCDAGPHSIAGILTDTMDTPPGVTTIWRILTRAGAITPEPRKRPKRSYLRFEADLPNECWQADFTHVTLAGGSDAEVLLFLDDHSRYLISATAHAPVTGRIVVDTFRNACATHGTPQSTLTDNGFVFTTSRSRGGPNAFEVLLADLGITQKNGTPNHPQTQGKVERLNQTLKKWLAARPPAATLTDLHHISLGIEHARTHVRMLIHDLDVTVINRDTGEIIRELTIDPTKNNQPRGVKHGPRPGHRKGGMPKGYTFKK